MTDAHHPIQLAARLTGLSTHVLRIWDQRYEAVKPRRTPTNHRFYSQSDIGRLTLLQCNHQESINPNNISSPLTPHESHSN